MRWRPRPSRTLTTPIRRTPTILQMEAVECGAAALGMVLGRYGRHVPLEELRATCGVSRDGVKASNLVKAAALYGLTAHGFRASVAELATYSLPNIIFWKHSHFVVVEGWRHGRVQINDPAQGRRRLSEAELEAGFSGIVLTFEPGPAFQPGGQAPGLVQSLARRLAGSWHAVLYCALVGLTLTLPALGIAAAAKLFVDDILVGQMRGWLLPLVAGTALVTVVQGGLSWLQQRYLLRLATKLAVVMSSSFLWHVLRLPIDFFAQRFAGDIAWRMSLNESVAQLMSGRFTSTLINLVNVVFYLLAMLCVSVPAGLACVLAAAVNALALAGATRWRAELSQRLAQEQSKLMASTIGTLQTIESIKAEGGEASAFTRWSGFYVNVLNARQTLGAAAQVLTVLPALFTSLAVVAVLIIGSRQVVSGDISIGTLVALQALAAALLRPFASLMSYGDSVQAAAGNLGRLDDVMTAAAHDAKPRHEAGTLDAAAADLATGVDAADAAYGADAGAAGIPQLRGFRAATRATPESLEPLAPPKAGARPMAGRLELCELSFGYSRMSEPLISGFNLVLEPGRRVALVGPSGCGKSTLARLVAGLYQPWSGEILLDGLPLRELPRARLAATLALVDQEIILFEGSITENLTLWDPTISEQSLTRAARDAQIHATIMARPGGYEASVSERGRNFSGGEAQRLEIARALARDPALLILDEATSALDPLVENEVDRAVHRRGCACLIVAHRLSTIRDCDEIIVLDRGRVVQRGTHDRLRAQTGLYAELIAP